MKRKLIFVTVLSILSVFAVSPVLATTYYVATNGLDANPGTLTQPWLTIGKAASIMVAGDTTYLRGGTYNITATMTPTNSGSAGNYITFAAYQGEIPILDGGNRSIRIFTLNQTHSYFRWIGLTMQNLGYTNGNQIGSGGGGIVADSGGNITRPHHIEVFNCTIRNCGLTSIKLRSVHDAIIAGCYATNCKGGYELKTYDPVSTGNDFNTENVQIIDCHAHNMHINSNTDNDGITGGGTYNSALLVYTSWCENIYVTGFDANTCWDDGIDLRGRYCTLDHCTACNVANPFDPADGHGYKFYAVDIPVDPNTYHAEFIKCVSYNNSREGYKLTSLMDNNTAGGSPKYIKQFRMLNCTSAGDYHGICLVTNSTHRMNVTFENCLISSMYCALDVNGAPLIWAPPPPGSGTVTTQSLPSYLTLDSNNNLWYAGANDPINYIGANYDLAGWQATSGVDINSISVNPVFDANYYPTNPACIDSGVNVGLPYAGSAPDMGAFESGTVDVNCPANYLTTGENWISIPVAAENDGPYSVFKNLGTWPNCVYLNLYRYDSPTKSLVQYPTYQSDPNQFGKIIPGGVYKLMLGGNQSTITVLGIAVKGTQTLTIGGSGTRDFYFGDPFNSLLYKSHCKIQNGATEVSIDDAISNGWIGNVQHFNPATKSWEAIGNILQTWHAYKLTAYTAGALQLNIYDLPAGDLNGDGVVDWNDLALMSENWLSNDCSNDPVGDLNNDCSVDFKDYAILAQNWTEGI